jgi:plastocyanin
MKKIYIVVSVVVIATIIVAVAINSGSKNTNMSNVAKPATQDAVATSQVNITNYLFSPATIKVSSGSTVTWTNIDNVHHTITMDSGSNGPNSGDIGLNQKYSFKFTKPGTYAYHCMIHPEMHGTVIVN